MKNYVKHLTIIVIAFVMMLGINVNAEEYTLNNLKENQEFMCGDSISIYTPPGMILSDEDTIYNKYGNFENLYEYFNCVHITKKHYEELMNSPNLFKDELTQRLAQQKSIFLSVVDKFEKNNLMEKESITDTRAVYKLSGFTAFIRDFLCLVHDLAKYILGAFFRILCNILSSLQVLVKRSHRCLLSYLLTVVVFSHVFYRPVQDPAV